MSTSSWRCSADHGDREAALTDARAGWRSRHSIHAADALAWALYRNARPASAARFERQALRLGTQDALSYFHAGMIAMRLGDREAARRLLGHALAINPHFSILYATSAQRTLSRLRG
jgi:Flp pilus assembly protein TadD